MTINEKHDWGTPAKRGEVSTGRDDESGSPQSSHALVDRLTAGEPYAVAFGGQGSAWLETLEELVSSAGIEAELATLVGEAELLLEPVARELIVVRPIGFQPMQWVRALAAEEAVPTGKHLTSAAVSVPGVLLTQMAAVRALSRQGMDLAETPPVAVAGHSQGVLAVEALAAKGAKDVELLALAQLIGTAGTLVARRRGISVLGDRPPMVSVTNADPERISELLEEFAQDVRTVLPPVLSIRNGRRSVVITGTPEQLSRFELYCEQIAEKEEAERKNKIRGGAVFRPMFDPVQVEVGFHTPRLSDAIDMVGDWAETVGLDVDLAREMAEAILVRRVDWVSEINDLHEAGARWILDLGPGDILTRLTAPVIRGLGVGIVPAATRGGQRNLFTVGAVPEVARPWSSYAPGVVTLPDGSVKLSTKFTRLTGRSPILLAGMTPTTVDAHIVAAAANAGHWSELAGGGQVTEEIFDNRIAELTSLLEPGRAVQFNSLFLDPYLWKLQVGGKRLVQKARQSGAPIDGVVVSAGIPELEEAVALIDELNDVGISHVVFKPGTIEQIRSVIRIAAEVPTKPVIMHVEGGRAGGHHSWEDLDDLLLATYSELRSRSNITVCVGGGVGTPERAAEYLSGRWAQAYGFPLMPVDGILVGTAAMATKESTTSPSVKQMLVDIGGTDDWISAGKAQGGMASSRSQLGADIHEIDNTASRCGRLLDEVAGDAEAVAARRDEIIAAMANTCKPYFGDVAEMTYAEWLQRYVDLAIGDGTSTADTASPGSPWLADTWRDRFAEMLKRAEARLHPKDFGPDRDAIRGVEKMKRCWRSRSRRSPRCWAATPTPTPSSCTRPTCRSSSSCARRWASRSTSCRSSTRMSGAGGAATRCGRPTTPATRPTRCASFPAPNPSQASPRSTSRSASCWTGSNRPRSTRCWRPVPSRSPSSPVVRREPTSPARWPLCSTRPTCCGPAAPPSTRSIASVHPRSGRSTKTGEGPGNFPPHTLQPAHGWRWPRMRPSR